MSISIQDHHEFSHFRFSVRLEDIQIDTLTNGAHDIETPNFHCHPFYEVQMALVGEYCIDFGGKQLRMSPDTLCLIPPLCYHRIRPITENPRQVCVRFICRQKSGQSDRSPISHALTLLPVDQPILLSGESYLCTLLKTLSEELSNPDFASALLLQSTLQLFYIRLLRSLKQPSYFPSNASAEDNIRNRRYYKIETFFNDNFAKAIVETDLAAELAVSKRQTSRILRQLYGKSFHDKLEETRMHHALQYLLLTDISTEAIAFKVGYSSASGFFVAFKRRFHMTPTEYRRAGGLRQHISPVPDYFPNASLQAKKGRT